VRLFAAVSSEDTLGDYNEPAQLTIFTPLISFLVVLISLLTLIATVAFFTDTGSQPTSARFCLFCIYTVFGKNGTNNILGITLTKFNKFSQLQAQFLLTCQLTTVASKFARLKPGRLQRVELPAREGVQNTHH